MYLTTRTVIIVLLFRINITIIVNYRKFEKNKDYFGINPFSS